MTATIEQELRYALAAIERVRVECAQSIHELGCRIAVVHELGGAEQSIGRVLNLLAGTNGGTHERETESNRQISVGST